MALAAFQQGCPGLARRLWRWASAAALAAALPAVVPLPAGAASWTAEQLYREGILSDGTPLHGIRDAGRSLSGPDAACAVCHRRSGLGTAEGKSIIPPISGDYLFRQRSTNLPEADDAPSALPPRGQGGVLRSRSAYTEESLARALREGIGSNGRPLSVLMPRYAIGDQDMAALIAYLRGLKSDDVPGVTDDTLHFATIITPDADPAARDGMLATMRQFFQDRNHIIAGTARPMAHDTHGVLYRVTRKWALHVWTLTGPAATWGDQLQAYRAREPVFAVVSGIGGADWAPVHRFCEASHLPCLFPNVDLPVVDESDFFPVYYSRGLFLEASLMADAIRTGAPAGSEAERGAAAPASTGVRRLVQVLRSGSGIEAAARQLAEPLAAQGWQAETRVLAGTGDRTAELARAIAVGPGTTLVLWLSPEDVAALPALPPPGAAVWLSGLLGGLEQIPLPPAWQPVSELSYPVELPERRALAMTLPEGWFRIKHIPLTRERVELQTYIACQILSETLGEMHVNFVPEYLVERLEVMLSHRRFNGMYPRLSLAPGQRFATKGGYLVHFAAPHRLVADGDWRSP
jgi:hypothetical protein